MSQENVEQHQRAFDAWNRRDLDAWLLLADPEFEFTPLNREMEGGGAYYGHDGIRRFWNDYLRVFPDFGVDAEEIRDLGEVTVARARLHATAPGSAVSFEQPIWQVVGWRDGKCIWWHSFRTEREALKAAGLSE